jgi:hypothetical protein
VQIEQRFFQRRIDHRFPLAASFGISLESLHVSPPPSRNRRFVVSLLDSATFRKRSMIKRLKKAT